MTYKNNGFAASRKDRRDFPPKWMINPKQESRNAAGYYPGYADGLEVAGSGNKKA